MKIAFDYMSYVVLGVGLIFFIIGLKKGLVSSLLMFIKGVGSIIAAFLLTKLVGNLIYNNVAFIHDPIFNMNEGFFNSYKDGLLNQVITEENRATLESAVLGSNMLLNLLKNPVHDLVYSEANLGLTLTFVLASFVSKMMVNGITFLILLVVLRILFAVITKSAQKINKVPVLGPVNRIFGGIFGLAEGLVICVVICAIAYALLSFNLGGESVKEFITLKMFNNLNDPAPWTIGKSIFTLFQQILASFGA